MGIDVKNAVLNGLLSIDMYMKQPEGFVVPGEEDLVYKLNKSNWKDAGLKDSITCCSK